MMNKELRETQIESLASSSQGEALREYISEKLTELSDISKAIDWDDVKGRQWAIKKLKDIFRKIQKKEVRIGRTNSYQ